MTDRDEVEALLAACEMIRDHELDPMKYSPIVPAPELAALCRAWLAMEDAPVGEYEYIVSDVAYIHFDNEGDAPNWSGDRVRIVKDPGEGRTKQ